MQEGFSYLAGAELPCVVADIMRGGPGLGNIAPEQGDYNQIVKGGGHGNYRTLVLAPDSVQEMADLTTLAFDLADRYRNPVVVLADGYIGQMMEPVRVRRSAPAVPPPPEWAVTGTAETRHNLVTSIYLEPDLLERHVRKLEAKYRAGGAPGGARRMLAHRGRRNRAGGLRHRGPRPEGRGGTWPARAAWRVGLLRPITLYPFPAAQIRELGRARPGLRGGGNEHRPDGGRCAAGARRPPPVEFYSRVGGNVPSAEEVLEFAGAQVRGFAASPRRS